MPEQHGEEADPGGRLGLDSLELDGPGQLTVVLLKASMPGRVRFVQHISAMGPIAEADPVALTRPC